MKTINAINIIETNERDLVSTEQFMYGFKESINTQIRMLLSIPIKKISEDWTEIEWYEGRNFSYRSDDEGFEIVLETWVNSSLTPIYLKEIGIGVYRMYVEDRFYYSNNMIVIFDIMVFVELLKRKDELTANYLANQF